MTDLIERLRKEDHGLSCECVGCYDIRCEAADELDRLRAEVERLQERVASAENWQDVFEKQVDDLLEENQRLMAIAEAVEQVSDNIAGNRQYTRVEAIETLREALAEWRGDDATN